MKKVENITGIKTLKDLRVAKSVAIKELENVGEELENSLSASPLQLLGGTIGLVTGFFLNKKHVNSPSQTESKSGEHGFFTNDFKDLATQLAIMGVTQIISRIFSKKSA